MEDDGPVTQASPETARVLAEMTAKWPARTGRRALSFDVDGAQFLPSGLPCSICGDRQDPSRDLSFVRVRETVSGRSEDVALLCPDCIARAMIQVERCGLWRQLSGAVAASVKRVFQKKLRIVPATAHPDKTGRGRLERSSDP